jgi:quercetin dioxygenase-like cupin family protein
MFNKRTCAITTTVAAAAAFGATALPTTAQTPPIVLEQLGDRSVFTDGVEVKFKVKDHDGEMTVVSTDDASRTVVARITVQPGARFPWHTHAGPVVANIDQGVLTYVGGDDCHEHSYEQGEAFVDSGHGHVHSAYNPGPGTTVVYATFFEAPKDGPLTIPAPAPDCAQ